MLHYLLPLQMLSYYMSAFFFTKKRCPDPLKIAIAN